jgi:replicative DNA helicase
MQSDLSLEAAAIAAYANLAAVDIRQAQVLLDASGIQAQDFQDGRLSAVWAVVEAMVRDGRTPDLFAVEAKCPGAPRRLLAELLMSQDMAPPRERLLAVRTAGQRRRISRALDVVRAVVADASRPLSEAIAEAQKALVAMHAPDGQAATLEADLFGLLDQLDEIARGRREPVLPTGIQVLDAVIGGLQPTLTVIGALPGVGKSALLAAIVRNLAASGSRVGVFSLEDERGWLSRRLVADASGVPLFVLQNRPMGPGQMRRVGAAVEGLHATLRHVAVDDRPAMTSADVVASARAMVTGHGAKALLVDHLGEIRLSRSERHDLDIADALQQLRALAKTYRVPVVVACHLRRREGLTTADDPRLTDFAFSAAVERMSRVALGLSRPSEGVLRVHVLKQTNGVAGGAVDLRFGGPAGVVANEAADPEQLARALRVYEENNAD